MENINLPTAAEVRRADRAVTEAYKKFYALSTARQQQALRLNQILVKLQEQTNVVRRREIFKRVEKVKRRVNQEVPHITVSVPGVSPR